MYGEQYVAPKAPAAPASTGNLMTMKMIYYLSISVTTGHKGLKLSTSCEESESTHSA